MEYDELNQQWQGGSAESGKGFCRGEQLFTIFCWAVVSLAAHTRADLQACQAGFSLPGTINALSFYLPIISA